MPEKLLTGTTEDINLLKHSTLLQDIEMTYPYFEQSGQPDLSQTT